MGRKFTLAVAFAFVLNILLMLGFYSLHLRPSVYMETDDIQRNIISIINETVSPQDAETLISKIKSKAYNTELRAAISRNMLKKLILFEVVVLLFLLLFIGLVTFHRFVKPIDLLAKSMEKYGMGILPEAWADAILKSERKDEIGKLQRQFLALTQSVEAEKQKQNHIIASVSHDIKTPLTVLMGYTERLLKNKVSSDKQDKYLHIMYAKAQSINEIINEFDEFLSYSFEGSLSLRNYAVSYVCDFIYKEYAEELADAGILFSIGNHCGGEERISLDLLKFKRVIGNLISNSIKHAGPAPSLSLRVAPSPKGVCFLFSDNGKGVAAEELPFLFDPFYTSDKSRKVAGIGLSICKNIITAHNGAIEAIGGMDRGLDIQITLPSVPNPKNSCITLS